METVGDFYDNEDNIIVNEQVEEQNSVFIELKDDPALSQQI